MPIVRRVMDFRDLFKSLHFDVASGGASEYTKPSAEQLWIHRTTQYTCGILHKIKMDISKILYCNVLMWLYYPS